MEEVDEDGQIAIVAYHKLRSRILRGKRASHCSHVRAVRVLLVWISRESRSERATLYVINRLLYLWIIFSRSKV